jgi:hypothetical protein
MTLRLLNDEALLLPEIAVWIKDHWNIKENRRFFCC